MLLSVFYTNPAFTLNTNPSLTDYWRPWHKRKSNTTISESKIILHELTIDHQSISMMFSSISYEHQKELIAEHSATKIFASLHIFLVKDNARGESVHTYII